MGNQLHKYIVSGSAFDLPSREYLKSVLERYAWFKLPAVILSDGAQTAQQSVVSEPARERNMIDTFLDKGSYRIVVTADTPDVLDVVDSQGDTYDSEIATEELADIYLSQGMKSHAVEIYSKLCLDYPEKSVYFAKLIAEIEDDNN